MLSSLTMGVYGWISDMRDYLVIVLSVVCWDTSRDDVRRVMLVKWLWKMIWNPYLSLKNWVRNLI